MKLSVFAKKNTLNKKGATPVSFSRLTKTQQEEALKKGAEKFSKDFTEVFTKLAKE